MDEEHFSPKKGFFCFLAQEIAWILPSVPRTPNPPGTSTPLHRDERHHSHSAHQHSPHSHTALLLHNMLDLPLCSFPGITPGISAHCKTTLPLLTPPCRTAWHTSTLPPSPFGFSSAHHFPSPSNSLCLSISPPAALRRIPTLLTALLHSTYHLFCLYPKFHQEDLGQHGCAQCLRHRLTVQLFIPRASAAASLSATAQRSVRILLSTTQLLPCLVVSDRFLLQGGRLQVSRVDVLGKKSRKDNERGSKIKTLQFPSFPALDSTQCVSYSMLLDFLHSFPLC